MPTIPGLQLVESLIVSNLGTGLEQTVSTTARDSDDNPVDANKLYNDGTAWEPTDAIDSDWEGELQVVMDQADVETTGASYKTFDLNIGAQVSVALDDAITPPSWMSTWVDSGRDHIVGNDTLSLFVKDFSPGTVTLGGNSGAATDSMYVVMVKPGYSRQPNVGTTGSIEFDSPTYSGDDDGQTITFFVNRVDGTVGAASAAVSISTDTSPGSTLNTTSVAWSAGDATQQSGTVTTPDLSADDILILGLGTFVGASEGNQSSTSIFISNTAAPPTESDYYVNGGTGNDNTLDGTSATVDGGGVGPWATHGKANATAITDSQVSVATGTYTNDPVAPINKVTFIPTGGDVTIKGPSGSNMPYGIDLTVAGSKALRDSGNQFIVDGNADKVQGSFPGGNIQFGGRMSAAGCVAEYRHAATMGYAGIRITGDNCEIRVESLQHGTTDTNGTGKPTGDVVIIEPPNGPTLMDGEGAGKMQASGHNMLRVDSGTGLLRHVHLDNTWEDVGTPFVANEGWRGGTIRSTGRWIADDCIFEHGGNDVIGGGGADAFRFGDGGEDHGACRCFFVNSQQNGLDLNADGTNGHRFSHLLFYNNEKAHINIREEGFPSIQQWVGGAKFYNIIFGNTPLIADSGPEDVLIKFHRNLSDSVEDLFEFAYNLVPADSYVYFRGTRMTLAQAEIDFPSVFHDNTVGDPDWVSPPSAPTFSNVYSGFATNVGSPARNAAIQLATITSTGSGTAMPVDDAVWFPHPHGFVDPTVGPATGGYQALHGGSLKTYTAVSNTVITLSSSSSWTINDTVSLPYTSSDPDIGPVQS